MIELAAQTGETEPLKQAVKALREVEELYSLNSTPRENAEVQQALADTLLNLGRANNDNQAIGHAIDAYRGAITIASLIGDSDMRAALKKNYELAQVIF